ncbi:MAG: glutamine synthetase [Bradymonadales bacterium]|nr:glutamine synthetase [Bradymonadales bacterium]
MGDHDQEKGKLGKLVAEGAVDTVIVAFPDHYGRFMGKRLPGNYFLEEVMEGASHSCNYLMTTDLDLEPQPGFRLASWDTGYGDFALKPDMSSLRLLPWLPGSALVVCDLHHEDGPPVEESPRRILKRQLEACRARGLTPYSASELEFFLFKGTYDQNHEAGFHHLVPTTPYLIDYHILGTTRDEPFLREVRNAMAQAGIATEGSKGEWGRGQHEVNLRYCEALQMADRHILFKEGIKILASKHGISACFMAKVHHDMAGSSCHIHISLFDEKGENALWDRERQGSSDLFRSFLAGCLAHSRELTLWFAPTVNSYKRYRATTFAPISVAWAEDNRTCGYRIVGHGQGHRIENRIPGADVNPYLAKAAMLAAGLDGIDRQLELPPATQGNAYTTPGIPRVPVTLAEAQRVFNESDFNRRVFGDEVVDHYARLAELEQAFFDTKVSTMEQQRYFERV